MRKIAIIDAGTNTFTMSIYEVFGQGQFSALSKERHYVNLAEKGLDRIGPEACQRALTAFGEFAQSLKNNQVDDVFAFGTAAIRRAANGAELVELVHQSTGIRIAVIDGAREANLIYQGVRLAAPLSKSPALIIDIGGGSVEFILCNQEQLLWAKSFPIGAAFLFHQLALSDPLGPADEQGIYDFFEVELEELLQALKAWPADQLIGASGTFDALDALLGAENKQETYSYLDIDAVRRLKDELRYLSLEQRIAWPEMPESRAPLIVVALSLINWVLSKAKINSNLVISDYALREGALWEICR